MKAFATVQKRIALLTSLPFGALDRMLTEQGLQKIGEEQRRAASVGHQLEIRVLRVEK